MYRYVCGVVVFVSLLGCATVPSQMVPYQAGSQQWISPGGVVYHQPCVPFRADSLMDWATALDTGRPGTESRHSRVASVRVRGDEVDCRSLEEARSSQRRQR